MSDMAGHLNVMRTSNVFSNYDYLWTIDNFSKMPKFFEGPPFVPIPGLEDKFCFELKLTARESALDVCLRKLSATEVKLNVDSHMTAESIDGELCHTEKILKEEIEERTHLMALPVSLINEKSLLFVWFRNRNLAYDELPKDALVLKGTLTFSGVISTICNAPSPANRQVIFRDLRYLYKSGLDYDFKFIVDGRIFRAHRAILLARSPVLKRMYYRN